MRIERDESGHYLEKGDVVIERRRVEFTLIVYMRRKAFLECYTGKIVKGRHFLLPGRLTTRVGFSTY